MKVFTSEQNNQLVAQILKQKTITSLNLMALLGTELTKALIADYGNKRQYIILCGDGSMGAIGFVIAQRLLMQGCDVITYIDKDCKDRTASNIHYLSVVKKLSSSIFDFKGLNEDNDPVWVDALLGIEFHSPLIKVYKDVIEHVNELGGIKLAIDLPSGLSSNNLPTKGESIFKADKTYTIGHPKLTFFFQETGIYVGELSIINFSIDKSILNSIATPYHISILEDIRKIYKPKRRFSHKGTYGHSLIIAGSHGKMGAAVMSTKSALKSGVGLVTSYVPNCGYNISQLSVPEAMCITDINETHIQRFPDIVEFDSVGVGCGLGSNFITKKAFYKWIGNGEFNNIPLVIDADGLNFLSEDKSYLNLLPPNTILTPHPKEFERLAGKSQNSLQRLEIARKFAERYRLVLILKDSYTSIIDSSGDVYFNSTGNPALATGGSGDSLTGIITGLLAQGYEPIDAAKLGAWLHGKSADIGIENESMETFSATDISKYLGQAFKLLFGAK